MFGTWMGIAVLIERVPNETLALFVLFEMWMRVSELIERVPIGLSLFWLCLGCGCGMQC